MEEAMVVRVLFRDGRMGWGNNVCAPSGFHRALLVA